MAFPELLEEGYEPHKTKTILLMNINKNNFAVDVSEVLPLKFKALAEHASQIPNLDVIKKRFTERAAAMGKQHGYAYAEAFMRIDLP